MFGSNRSVVLSETPKVESRGFFGRMIVRPVNDAPVYDAGADALRPSIISEGFHLSGDIESQGVLHIEGTVIGNLRSENVTIGAKGKIVGNVRCKILHVMGSFEGEASC